MDEYSDIVKVYTGSEVTVALLKSELEKAGIVGMTRNEFASGVASGFYGDSPSSIDLYVQQSDLKKAGPIIKGFVDLNK
ncbi:MAG TPA: DUF2007 domain-containing protein [Bacteroidales bacterium]|jgi:hypothetical protein|nr:DUF2007 domain-containing protein [Bacteroidales bacterium]